MIAKIGRRRWSVYAFDVESHNDPKTVELCLKGKKSAGIWIYSFVNESSKEEDETSFGYSIEQFLTTLEKMTREEWHDHKRKLSDILIYVYNLSFEWSFLLPKMLEAGFKWKQTLDREEPDKAFSSVTTKTCSSVWQAELSFGPKHGHIMFKDINKIYKGSLASVAKSLGLDDGKIEEPQGFYEKDRTAPDYKPTDEERRYSFRDSHLLMEILGKIQEKGDKDFFKSCSAGGYACRKMINEGFPHAFKPMKVFRRFYPIANDDETKFLRHTVAGGITYVTPWTQFKDLKCDIGHIDIHQAHPNSAYRHLYPYGLGEYFQGKPPREHIRQCALHLKISYTGVKLHSVIQLIGIDIATDYEIWLWNFELPTMYKCYENLEVEYIDGYAYPIKRLPWRDFYMNNYKERQRAKEIKDLFAINDRKLRNNSSYGKLIEHGHVIAFENVIGADGALDSVEHEIKDSNDYSRYTYIPIGSSIPAWTRVYLIETALKLGWRNIVYFDTDSIFYLKNEETAHNIKQVSIGEELGDFGQEADITRAQFSAPKRYKIMELKEDKQGKLVEKLESHLAGINFKKSQPTDFDGLDIIKGNYLVQSAVRVKGGTVIVMKPRQLKVQSKYMSIYENNCYNEPCNESC